MKGAVIIIGTPDPEPPSETVRAEVVEIPSPIYVTPTVLGPAVLHPGQVIRYANDSEPPLLPDLGWEGYQIEEATDLYDTVCLKYGGRYIKIEDRLIRCTLIARGKSKANPHATCKQYDTVLIKASELGTKYLHWQRRYARLSTHAASASGQE